MNTKIVKDIASILAKAAVAVDQARSGQVALSTPTPAILAA